METFNRQTVRALRSDGTQKSSTDTFFASNFYLHGQLQAMAGFDLCEFNGNLLSKVLHTGVYLATCNIEHVEPQKCLVFSASPHGRNMEGYVVQIDDVDAIMDAIAKFRRPSMYEHVKDYLRENHKVTYELLTV